MAKLITSNCFSCGKTFSRKVATFNDHVATDQTCWDCQRKLSALSAKTLSKKLELPELQGSEKQIEWGGPVRLQVVNELIVRLTDFFDEGSQARVAKKILVHILARPNLVRAGFWIEHRHNIYGLKNYILKLATEEIKKSTQLQQYTSSMSGLKL